ncbi:MAG: hypothetical protein HC784_11055 [Hydrococcus sp. CSU_1_8]|nr:hypothetical protein [Hydrococcus sp. CSU_1_8]
MYSSNMGSRSYGSGAKAYSTGADRIAPFSQRHKTLTPILPQALPLLRQTTKGVR